MNEFKLTPSQKKTLDQFRKEIEKEMISDNVTYEFKKWEISTGYGGMIYVVSEYGLVDDEGTMASVFARDHRHVVIGKRGAIKLLNPKKKTNAHGMFYAVHGLTS